MPLSAATKTERWHWPTAIRPPRVLPLLLLQLLSCHSPIGKSATARDSQRIKQLVWSPTNPLFFRNGGPGPDGGPSSPFASSASSPRTPPPLVIVHHGDSLDFECAFGHPLVVSAVSEMALIECQLDSGSTPFLICDGKSQQQSKRKRLVFGRQQIPMNFPSQQNYAGEGGGDAGTAEDRVQMQQPGSIRHFISTSNGSATGLWNSRGGLCAAGNLRLRVEFADEEEGEQQTGTQWNGAGLEYSIEEMPWAPTAEGNEEGGRQKSKIKQKKEEEKEENDSRNDKEGSENNDTNGLARRLRIKPEYLEFVRNHAISGGTGQIRFPPTEDEERDGRVKWPRFVSWSSEPWPRVRTHYPPLSAPMHIGPAANGAQQQEQQQGEGKRNGEKSESGDEQPIDSFLEEGKEEGKQTMSTSRETLTAPAILIQEDGEEWDEQLHSAQFWSPTANNAASHFLTMPLLLPFSFIAFCCCGCWLLMER